MCKNTLYYPTVQTKGRDFFETKQSYKDGMYVSYDRRSEIHLEIAEDDSTWAAGKEAVALIAQNGNVELYKVFQS